MIRFITHGFKTYSNEPSVPTICFISVLLFYKVWTFRFDHGFDLVYLGLKHFNQNQSNKLVCIHFGLVLVRFGFESV